MCLIYESEVKFSKLRQKSLSSHKERDLKEKKWWKKFQPLFLV